MFRGRRTVDGREDEGTFIETKTLPPTQSGLVVSKRRVSRLPKFPKITPAGLNPVAKEGFHTI
jgi:hypothetical protein